MSVINVIAKNGNWLLEKGMLVTETSYRYVNVMESPFYIEVAGKLLMTLQADFNNKIPNMLISRSSDNVFYYKVPKNKDIIYKISRKGV